MRTEQNRTRLEMVREEISRLSKHVDERVTDGKEVFSRLKTLDLRMQRLEKIVKPSSD